MNCKATIGQVGNIDHENVQIGKAGRTRHLRLPAHGARLCYEPLRPPPRRRRGQEPHWPSRALLPPGASPRMGYKTRKTKNRTDKYIVRRRNGK